LNEPELERYLHAQMPLARAMGVRVVHADGDRVRLAAPLAPNLNHRQTFFGGSASALATLAAWTLAHQRLLESEGLDVHLVIQRSSMEYLEPAAAEVEAECVAPPAADWERLLRTVRRRGKGRIELAVELRVGPPGEAGGRGAVVGAFRGTFVALTEAPGSGQPS
jgi:thioesterase domain-containing protein